MNDRCLNKSKKNPYMTNDYNVSQKKPFPGDVIILFLTINILRHFSALNCHLDKNCFTHCFCTTHTKYLKLLHRPDNINHAAPLSQQFCKAALSRAIHQSSHPTSQRPARSPARTVLTPQKLWKKLIRRLEFPLFSQLHISMFTDKINYFLPTVCLKTHFNYHLVCF